MSRFVQLVAAWTAFVSLMVSAVQTVSEQATAPAEAGDAKHVAFSLGPDGLPANLGRSDTEGRFQAERPLMRRAATPSVESAPSSSGESMLGFKKLDASDCVEIVLVEPRKMQAMFRAAESAVNCHCADLVTVLHGSGNRDFVHAGVSANPVLSKAEQQKALRFLHLHVDDLNGDNEVAVQIDLALQDLALEESSARGKDMMDSMSEEEYHDAYSKILKSPAFWNKLTCDRVLVMQSDTLLCSNTKVQLSEFDKYDYVGGLTPKLRYVVGHQIRTHINGGFSLRNRRKMLECIEHSQCAFPTKCSQEDIFYSKCEFLNLPVDSVANRFAVDNSLIKVTEVPFGVHKPWGMGEYKGYTMNLCPGSLQLMEEVLADMHQKVPAYYPK